jgi:hypothetical protein
MSSPQLAVGISRTRPVRAGSRFPVRLTFRRVRMHILRGVVDTTPYAHAHAKGLWTQPLTHAHVHAHAHAHVHVHAHVLMCMNIM